MTRLLATTQLLVFGSFFARRACKGILFIAIFIGSVMFAANAAEPLPKGWRTWVTEDPMDDTKETYFYLDSYKHTGTDTAPYIGIACESQKLFIVTDEIITGHSLDETTIHIRFDKENAQSYGAQTYGEHSSQAQLNTGSVKAMEKIIQSNQMIIKISIYQDKFIHAWFDLKGSSKVVSRCAPKAKTTATDAKAGTKSIPEKAETYWIKATTEDEAYAKTSPRTDGQVITVACDFSTGMLTTTVRIGHDYFPSGSVDVQTKVSGFNGHRASWTIHNANTMRLHGSEIPNRLMDGKVVYFRFTNSKGDLYITPSIPLKGSVFKIRPVVEACQ